MPKLRLILALALAGQSPAAPAKDCPIAPYQGFTPAGTLADGKVVGLAKLPLPQSGGTQDRVLILDPVTCAHIAPALELPHRPVSQLKVTGGDRFTLVVAANPRMAIRYTYDGSGRQIQTQELPPLPDTPPEAPTDGSDRVAIASGVRVRGEPKTSAKEVTRLSIGAPVRTLDRTNTPEQVGQWRDIWYQVATQDGKQGWVFGTFLGAFDPARGDAIRIRIARTQLANEQLGFPELVDLWHLLNRAAEGAADRAIQAELKLLRLQTLQRSLDRMGGPDEAAYDQWLVERQEEIVTEPIPVVNHERFEQLYRDYADTPLAEEIAYAAAVAPLGGECEGDPICMLIGLTRGEAEYLHLYPKGRYQGQLIPRLEEGLKMVKENLAIMELGDDPGYRVDFDLATRELRGKLENLDQPARGRLLAMLRGMGGG